MKPSAELMSALQDPDRAPLDILIESARNGTACATSMSECLQKYRTSLQPLAESQATARIRTDKPGKRAFKWLLVDAKQDLDLYRRHMSDALDDRDFLQHLCYFLLREGDESMIWEWFRSHSLDFDSATYNAVRWWRSSVIAALVCAQMDIELTGHSTRSADKAILTIKEALRLMATDRTHRYPTNTQYHPALSAVARLMRQGYFPDTDPDLWDWVRDQYVSMRDWKMQINQVQAICNSFQDALQGVRLDLEHPVRPTADSAIELLGTLDRIPPNDVKSAYLPISSALTNNVIRILVSEGRHHEIQAFKSLASAVQKHIDSEKHINSVVRRVESKDTPRLRFHECKSTLAKPAFRITRHPV